jgi:hypothetical protein
MRRGHSTAGVITALALPGLGLGLGLGLTASASAATAHAAGAVAAKSPRYVVLDCGSKAQVEPGTYVLTCADAGIGLANLPSGRSDPGDPGAVGGTRDADAGLRRPGITASRSAWPGPSG